MSKISKLFLTFLLLSIVTFGQSGRSKGVTGAWPTPPAPVAVASPSPDATKSSKPSLPKIVEGERIYTSIEVDQKLRILRRPTPPSYPREARKYDVRGFVLRAILAADETVKHIEVIMGLPYGLSEKAIEATRQIKFKPAMKDGKPVSSWMEFVYRFNTY